ncbi:hypothetical protein FISHEDRAFT_59731 [Fistulina hepatica ATCC 64428]|uniref:Uncharacterized protein n=1 Tax=Fistulina hepatica ATCC 64428 TaxID=1128425 RepID=A0A0D7A951_9AGAR|nr:hypothetical protein FISHEDRAFT_59731 [Fistulina hepatica ATCC 64428]
MMNEDNGTELLSPWHSPQQSQRSDPPEGIIDEDAVCKMDIEFTPGQWYPVTPRPPVSPDPSIPDIDALLRTPYVEVAPGPRLRNGAPLPAPMRPLMTDEGTEIVVMRTTGGQSPEQAIAAQGMPQMMYMELAQGSSDSRGDSRSPPVTPPRPLGSPFHGRGGSLRKVTPTSMLPITPPRATDPSHRRDGGMLSSQRRRQMLNETFIYLSTKEPAE